MWGENAIAIATKCMTKKATKILHKPLCSPDLDPCIFFIFLETKIGPYKNPFSVDK